MGAPAARGVVALAGEGRGESAMAVAGWAALGLGDLVRVTGALVGLAAEAAGAEGREAAVGCIHPWDGGAGGCDARQEMGGWVGGFQPDGTCAHTNWCRLCGARPPATCQLLACRPACRVRRLTHPPYL